MRKFAPCFARPPSKILNGLDPGTLAVERSVTIDFTWRVLVRPFPFYREKTGKKPSPCGSPDDTAFTLEDEWGSRFLSAAPELSRVTFTSGRGVAGRFEAALASRVIEIHGSIASRLTHTDPFTILSVDVVAP